MDITRIDVRATGPGEVVVAVSGEVDLRTHDNLFESLHTAVVDAGVKKVVVDLSRTTFLDSGGVGVLVAAGNAARAANVNYSVAGATGIVRRVLAVTGVLDTLAEESLTDEAPPP